MPLSFHSDPDTKFRHMYLNAQESMIPFIAAVKPLESKNVLEIGCGEGGNLKAFLEHGCTCVGIDLSPSKIERAKNLLEAYISSGRVKLAAEDIYSLADESAYNGRFDLIILKDVIEHVPDKIRLLRKSNDFLAPGGVIFLAFPPWFNPYGGHQQMSRATVAKLPYYHLLPKPIVKRFLQLVGEPEVRIANFMDLIDTRLSINRFERILVETGYTARRRSFYLINPIYKYKFGLPPFRQLPLIRNVPGLRDVVSTTAYYLIAPEGSDSG